MKQEILDEIHLDIERPRLSKKRLSEIKSFVKDLEDTDFIRIESVLLLRDLLLHTAAVQKLYAYCRNRADKAEHEVHILKARLKGFESLKNKVSGFIEQYPRDIPSPKWGKSR